MLPDCKSCRWARMSPVSKARSRAVIPARHAKPLRYARRQRTGAGLELGGQLAMSRCLRDLWQLNAARRQCGPRLPRHPRAIACGPARRAGRPRLVGIAVGPGRRLTLALFVICPQICWAPAAAPPPRQLLNPATRKPYGATFPTVTAATCEVQPRLLEHLGTPNCWPVVGRLAPAGIRR